MTTAPDVTPAPALPPTLDAHLDQAGRRPRHAGRMRRIVVRMGSAEVDRLDALRMLLLPRSVSRAALVRAFTLSGLATFAGLDAPKLDGCEP